SGADVAGGGGGSGGDGGECLGVGTAAGAAGGAGESVCVALLDPECAGDDLSRGFGGDTAGDGAGTALWRRRHRPGPGPTGGGTGGDPAGVGEAGAAEQGPWRTDRAA